MDATIGALRDMLTRVIREDRAHARLASGGAAVVIDPHDLEQVVFNLVINARDACRPAARFAWTWRADDRRREQARRHLRRAGRNVRLRVRDNGTGMTADVQAHLFEPFFTTKQVGEGTGLGLAFVDGIARHGRGFVTVDSALAQGTTISVFLPVAPPAPAPPAEPASIRIARRAAKLATILLVEDENGVRETTARILTHAGYKVIATETPAEALEVFAGAPAGVDLLLTDVVMPDMHGPELAERLLESRPELPVVFVSGYSDVMPATATATARMAFVPKPFAAAALVVRSSGC